MPWQEVRGLAPEKFAEKMNEKALQLGALNTKFNEPTGMDQTIPPQRPITRKF